jgi:hypothetical protein
MLQTVQFMVQDLYFCRWIGNLDLQILANTGIYEYVIATNNVPLTGGNLTFKGAGTGGVINSFLMLMQLPLEVNEHFKLLEFHNILI